MRERHVLSCGLPVLPQRDERPVLTISTDTPAMDADPYAAVADVVLGSLRTGDTVLAVIPSWDREPNFVRLQAVRSALETTHLVFHHTALPPLAAGALVSQLAHLAVDTRLTTVDWLRAAELLEERTCAAAWLGSVANLEHPAPPLSLHARSWARLGAFAAIVDDDPRVVALKKGASMPLPADVEGAHAIMGVGEGDVAAVERSLAGTVSGVTKVRTDDISHRHWGTDKLVDLAFAPADLEGLVQHLVTTRPTARCRWCDAPVAGEVCAFCTMRHTPDGDEPVVHATVTSSNSSTPAPPVPPTTDLAGGPA